MNVILYYSIPYSTSPMNVVFSCMNKLGWLDLTQIKKKYVYYTMDSTSSSDVDPDNILNFSKKIMLNFYAKTHLESLELYTLPGVESTLFVW